MKGPARNGVLVYAADKARLSNFYIEVFGMSLVRTTDDFIALDVDGLNVIVHNPPIELPDNHFNTVKLFISVPDLESSRKKVVESGGADMEGEWSNPFFKCCNVIDPEGNHVQLREFTHKKWQ